MTPWLLEYLCDPVHGKPLKLSDPEYDENGRIAAGMLVGQDGVGYPIRNGIPRFVPDAEMSKSVDSFGDEWNHFNFTDFKSNWLNHTVANTFGSKDAFRDKVIVDAGGGSGAQTLWMLESGARHVIMLELSHSVDDVAQRNLASSGFTNYDIVQCSIDAPPVKSRSIDGIVICHNVIQHTPSVAKTALALFGIVAEGGEFVFNCYMRYNKGALRLARYYLIYLPLRNTVSRLPFSGILLYARLMGLLRLVPLFGYALEKAGFALQGEVTERTDSVWASLSIRYKATVLNTFDFYGSHRYQHLLSDEELKEIVSKLQPDLSRVRNFDRFFSRPPTIGCALRVFR